MVQVTHSIAKLLYGLLAQPDQLAQFFDRRFGQLRGSRPLLRGESGDPPRV
jgi:hypothetical protein